MEKQRAVDKDKILQFISDNGNSYIEIKTLKETIFKDADESYFDKLIMELKHNKPYLLYPNFDAAFLGFYLNEQGQIFLNNGGFTEQYRRSKIEDDRKETEYQSNQSAIKSNSFNRCLSIIAIIVSVAALVKDYIPALTQKDKISPEIQNKLQLLDRKDQELDKKIAAIDSLMKKDVAKKDIKVSPPN